jgi:hypothetical protein
VTAACLSAPVTRGLGKSASLVRSLLPDRPDDQETRLTRPYRSFLTAVEPDAYSGSGRRPNRLPLAKMDAANYAISC